MDGTLDVHISPADEGEASGPLADAATIARLAALDPITYDRVRKAEADALNIRPATLDEEVKKVRPAGTDDETKQGRALFLEPPEPWPHPVDGAELLDALAQFFVRHLALQPGAATVLAVWAVHTHCFTTARHTPRLAITSAEKGSGKTTCLDLLELVVRKPLPTAHITAAATFRTVEAAMPTLLVDEADTFLAESEELRGVLNAGHKRGGQVVRCVGDDAEPRAFAAFAPAAIAAIGTLPGTLADRSITITMRRASKAEQPAPIRDNTERAGATLARKAARWASDHETKLRATEPKLPAALVNRAGDNWRILFGIVGQAGGQWPAKLASAVTLLNRSDDNREGTGVTLLRDIRDILTERGAVRLSTTQIVSELAKMDDRPWPEVSNGRPITACYCTRRLKSFGIPRVQWRVPGTEERVWGFQKDDFADAWARYLTGDTAPLSPDEVVTSPLASAEKPNEYKDVTSSPLFPGGVGAGAGCEWEATL